MFGIDGGKFLALVVIAVVVVGPERLPGYAEKLAVWVRTLRTFLREAKQRVDEELGDQVGDVDWAALDPRRYDPRRIVREALLDDPPASPRAAADQPAAQPVAEPVAQPVGDLVGEVAVAPYDDEAT